MGRKKKEESSANTTVIETVDVADIPVETPIVTPPQTNTQDKPKEKRIFAEKVDRSSPDWSEYVMSKFSDDELDGVNPRLEGLRRVAINVIGNIIEENVDVIATPCPDNAFTSVIKATITFDADGKIVKYSAAADACESNCTDEFQKFPTAMADTRAKGRAFRSALGLNRIVAAEEMSVPVDGDQVIGGDKIKQGQISAIRIMADRLNVSIAKTLKHLEFNTDKLESLTHSEALTLVRALNNYQNNHIPNSIKKSE